MSGGFAAKGASYGIESSFSNVEIARSASPMRAAITRKNIERPGTSQRVFFDRHHGDCALGQSRCSGVIAKSHICKCEISHQNNIFRLFFEERFQLSASLTPTFARTVVIATNFLCPA